MRYSDNIDYLLAATTYLASHTYYWARTPEHMSRELSLDRARLQAVFDGFPGIFRRSLKPSPHSSKGEHFYSLQARYALREGNGTGEPEQVSYIEPPSTETFHLLVQFIKDQAARETELTGIEEASRQAHKSAMIAAVAAGAALISVVIGIIQHSI